jgi:dihydroorotase
MSGLPSFSRLLLKSGRLLDPRNGRDGQYDLYIDSGKIARITADPGPSSGWPTIDVSGLLVTPALVDIHTHLFATAGVPGGWAGDSSVLPDGFSFRSGTTTMVDAGSAGWKNFDLFRCTVIERARTRIFALLNIASLGMTSESTEQHERDFEAERTAAVAREHSPIIVGLKAAHYWSPDWLQVDRALEAAGSAAMPLMVDFGHFKPERPFPVLVTEKLRPGDIATHCFRGPVPWIDAEGRLYGYLTRARQRGIRFDVGHGEGSFLFRNAVPAVAQGFFPDSISTDLHAFSMNASMMDLPTVMSKFLAMGMPLPEVISRATTVPAQMIGHPELGQLAPGAAADIAVWKLMRGEFGFGDAGGGRFEGERRLFCEMTLKDGKVAWDWNARSTRDFRELGPRYGIREEIETLVPPDGS